MATKNELPKGMVSKKNLAKAIQSIPDKIADIARQRLLEKAVSTKEAIKECFEAHPALLEMTIKEVQTILSSLDIETSAAVIHEVKTQLKSKDSSVGGTTPNSSSEHTNNHEQKADHQPH